VEPFHPALGSPIGVDLRLKFSRLGVEVQSVTGRVGQDDAIRGARHGLVVMRERIGIALGQPSGGDATEPMHEG
jgi:hypothetical protein